MLMTTWHLEDCDPGVSDVVEGDGVVEWIGVGHTARRVVAIPVDTRLIGVDSGGRHRRGWPVVDRRRRVAARAVDGVRQQVEALGHAVAVRHTADEVEASMTVERRQRHASTRRQHCTAIRLLHLTCISISQSF